MSGCQRFFYHAIAMALLCVASIAYAKENHMLIDQVPALKGMFVPEAPMAADQHPDEQVAFKRTVEAALAGKYRVTAQHLYFYPIHVEAGWPPVNPGWPPLRMSVADSLGGMQGQSVYHDPGFSPHPVLEVWKVGGFRPQYFALSMTVLDDGNALVGYFELEKE